MGARLPALSPATNRSSTDLKSKTATRQEAAQATTNPREDPASKAEIQTEKEEGAATESKMATERPAGSKTCRALGARGSGAEPPGHQAASASRDKAVPQIEGAEEGSPPPEKGHAESGVPAGESQPTTLDPSETL